LAGDDIAADFMGYGKKSGSDGIYYTHWLVKDAKGVPFLHTYLVVTDPNYAISIPTGSHVLGSFNGLDTVDSGSIHRDISLTTGFAYINGNNRQQLTLDILNSFIPGLRGLLKLSLVAYPCPAAGMQISFLIRRPG
jgi:triacylglycerol esterase/lipase EstA (alpha/beta hydrolase family)